MVSGFPFSQSEETTGKTELHTPLALSDSSIQNNVLLRTLAHTRLACRHRDTLSQHIARCRCWLEAAATHPVWSPGSTGCYWSLMRLCMHQQQRWVEKVLITWSKFHTAQHSAYKRAQRHRQHRRTILSQTDMVGSPGVFRTSFSSKFHKGTKRSLGKSHNTAKLKTRPDAKANSLTVEIKLCKLRWQKLVELIW